jgi:lipopolysaccharide biosynthesis protein
MRLLLRAGANASVENNNGKSPLAIAKERNHHLCEEMVSYFYSFKGGIISDFFFAFWLKSPKKRFQITILSIFCLDG